MTSNNEMTRWNDYSLAITRDGESIVMVDCSGSMLDETKHGESKLTAAVKAAKDCEGSMLCFGPDLDTAAWLCGSDIKCDVHIKAQGTPMVGALEHSATMSPRRVVTIVGDGQPTDGTNQEAFEAALKLGCPVNTVFIGAGRMDEIDREGRELMIAISAATGGYFVEVGVDDSTSVSSLYTELSETLTESLALPAKAGRTR